jgi:hypothetical protein
MVGTEPDGTARTPRAAWPDRLVMGVTALTVAGLAGVAGAISYSQMVELAFKYGETDRWRAHMFPLSVDGVEIVASLVLLAERRAGRRSPRRAAGFADALARWLPWVAIGIGTAASLAANIAVGGAPGREGGGWLARARVAAGGQDVLRVARHRAGCRIDIGRRGR